MLTSRRTACSVRRCAIGFHPDAGQSTAAFPPRTLRGYRLRVRSAPSSRFRCPTYRASDGGSPTGYSGCSALRRVQIRCAVCRCFRGASRSSSSICSIRSLIGPKSRLLLSFRFPRWRNRRADRLPDHSPVNAAARRPHIVSPATYPRRISSNSSTLALPLSSRHRFVRALRWADQTIKWAKSDDRTQTPLHGWCGQPADVD